MTEVMRADYYDPWLAVGVVSLLTNARVTDITNWRTRGLIPHIATCESSGAPLYSPAAVCWVAVVNAAVTFAGTAVKHARKIGDAAMQRLEGLIATHGADPTNWLTDDMAFCAMSGGELRIQYLAPDAMRANLERPGLRQPWDSLIGFQATTAIPVDSILERTATAILCRISASDDVRELNRLALAGRLKPFPKELK